MYNNALARGYVDRMNRENNKLETPQDEEGAGRWK